MRVARWVLFVFSLLSLPLAAQTFVFDLRGSQEVPPVPSTHTGGCMGVLNQGAATFSVTCVHDVAGATVMHIHQGAAGTNGVVLFDLGNPASPVTATWTGMTAQNISDLLAGNLYINIHTSGRPSGEIRGQILPRTVDTVAFTADGSQVVPPNASNATASCTADLNNAADAMAVSCTHNLATPSAAHIHQGSFGTNGPIIYTFADPTNLNANVPLNAQQVAAFAATLLYLDIHGTGGTEANPADEIRGQIGTPPAGAGTGTIVIKKATSPGGGAGFNFTENITPGGFTLNDGGTRTFNTVSPGTYTISEAPMSGWTVGDVSCDDANSAADEATATATINVEAGETVTCTFRNFAVAPTDTIFAFRLSGDQEVPPVVTPETGGCMARFRAATSSLSIVCTHDVNLPTVMHIHQGAPGTTGDVLFDLGSPVSPVIATWDGMTPAQVAALLAGNLYVNIHTSGRPSGAIRGQIVPRSIDALTFPMDAAQVVPPGTSAASGTCTADLNTAADALAVSCTHNLPTPDQAHVHTAPRGQNGPITYTFPSATSPFSSNVPMTPRNVADFEAGFLYVDVHGPDVSEESASDEIRGQIDAPVVVPTTGTIRIIKATSPAGGTNFPFTETMTNGSFTLSDGGVQTFNNVAAGTYTVTEGTVSGWSLTDVTCGDDDSTGNPFNRTASIHLAGGETVTCTFRNLQSVAAPQRFIFHMSGDQEVPPSGSAARGGCYAQLDSATRRLALICTHNVASPTIAHIHRGAAGQTGPVLFDLGDPTSPMEATWNMTPADVDDLLAGRLYVNIHAAGRPEGEIRGQMLVRTVDSFSFTANGAQEVPPTDSTHTGSCTADLANDASFVSIVCTHNIPNPSSTHMHDAPPGVDGPVIYDFPNTSPFSGNVPLTPRLVADFAAGFLYVNIHSLPDYEQGEIRGQAFGPATAQAAAAAIPTLGQWALLLLALALAAVAFLRVR